MRDPYGEVRAAARAPARALTSFPKSLILRPIKSLALGSTTCLVLLASLPALAQTTWTVSPSGPADFTSVAAAVAAASNGDILLIAPGSYGAVTVQKSLTLLGSQDAASRPTFTILTVESVAVAKLFHLEAEILRISNVNRGHVEGLVVNSETLIGGARDLYIRGCEFRGAEGFVGAPSRAAVSVGALGAGNRVTIVDSLIVGGGSADSVIGISWPGAPGIQAVVLEGERLNVVGTDVIGGSRLGAGITPGAAAALFAQMGGGTVTVRGSSIHGLRGGAAGSGQPLGSGPAVQVFPWFGSVTGPLLVGQNLELLGTVGLGSTLVPAEPYAQWTGVGGPGSSRTFEVFGTVGHVGVAFIGVEFVYNTTTLSTLGEPFTVNPATLLLTPSGVLQGQDVPWQFAVSIPPIPSLAGVSLASQAAVVSPLDLSIRLTNSDSLTLSY